MNPETPATNLNHDPFIPIRLLLSDGQTIDIRNPGLCFIAHLAINYFRAKPHDALAEDVQVISLRHIASIEPLDPAKAA